jgi:glycine/D-amino acid oxidase-like deaminating enzyme
VQTFLGISRPLADADMARVFASDRVMTWDTDLIYHYFRAAERERILVGGGDLAHTYAHSQATSMARNARRLTAYFRSRFPDVALELEYVWPGMLGVSKDLLPVMGVDEQHDTVWYAGAATGLPWAAALGIYAAERILGKRNEFDETLSWRRGFKINPRTQALLTKPVSFAICNGIAKYS